MPRRYLDQYETPPHYVAPLLDLVGPLNGLRVYEPCTGQGHIAKYLAAAGGTIITNDLDKRCVATMHEDAREERAWPLAYFDPADVGDWQVDWAITNPPFRDELAILVHALVNAKNVAFLARLSFLEPTLTREVFWRAHPPTDVIVLPRYSFRLDDQGKRQTDNVTCCWLVWRAGGTPCMRFSDVRGGANGHGEAQSS